MVFLRTRPGVHRYPNFVEVYKVIFRGLSQTNLLTLRTKIRRIIAGVGLEVWQAHDRAGHPIAVLVEAEDLGQ